MLKKFWRPETGIFLAVWLLLMIGGRSRFLRDPGTFWHTVVGDQLISSRQLIYTDSFSFTFQGHSWIPHQWLGEILMALIHRLDGLDSLLWVTVSLLALLYTAIAHRLIRSGLHWSLSALLVALTIAASSSHFHIRPHIATILFLAWTYLLLCDFEAGRISLRELCWLIPMYLLWSSIHGGMLGGLATVCLTVAGWTFARLVRQPSPISRYRQLDPLAGIIVACGLTAFINPYGWRLPWTWREIMSSPLLPQIIKEHAPLNPARPEGWIVLVLGLVYGATLLSVQPRWPRISWLLPFVWLCLTLKCVRHAPLFAVMAGFGLADMLPHTRWAARLARSGSDLFQFRAVEDPGASPRWDLRPALLPIALVLMVGVLQWERIELPVVGHGWARLDPTYWPVELTNELKKHEHTDSAGTPIFNEYLYGGFLIYYTPGYKVLVDDRCELYGDQWLKDYVQAESTDAAAQVMQWEKTYPRYDFALTQSNSSFDRFFHAREGWKLVRETGTANLYARTQPDETTGLARASAR